ncbi:unnamed protein product [Rotaria sordida]|uniref:Uncharacterized protein n=1 Tax=Rotaria sordida TaxID=392033 RepID=A0A814TLI2_9BILA|nr:unnamed protein product [Rotaria sordida]
MEAKSDRVFNDGNLPQTTDPNENKKWKDMNRKDRIKSITILILRLIGLLALLYLFVCSLDLMSSVCSFFVVPLIVFGLSLAGWYVFGGVLGPIVLIIILIILINILQRYKPKFLPAPLRTWLWLPVPFRSLAFYDRCLFSKKCFQCKKKVHLMTNNENIHNNETYIGDIEESL